jgi:hypothetical protein
VNALLCAAVLAMAASNPEHSDDAIASLGAELAALRAEVDGLSADVSTARAQAKEEQLALTRRRAALEGDLESARLLVAELRTRIDAMERAHGERTTAAATTAAPLIDALTRLRALVRAGVPFQTNARLERLDAVEHALSTSPPDVLGALAALEPILVDEARLARSTQRARQPVVVDGEPVVADIIRIGTVAVLFRAPNGAVGFAAHDAAAGASPWRTLVDEGERAQVNELFALYRKDPPDRVLLVPRAALPVVRGGGAR